MVINSSAMLLKVLKIKLNFINYIIFSYKIHDNNDLMLYY